MQFGKLKRLGMALVLLVLVYSAETEPNKEKQQSACMQGCMVLDLWSEIPIIGR